jgi:hypothetical protein
MTNALPIIAGKARLMSHTTNEAVITADESGVITLNTNTATAPRVAISVKAKVGTIEVIKNVIAISTAAVIKSGVIPKTRKIK